MGYYTNYELNFNTNNPEEETKILNRIQEISGYTYLFSQEVKWYDHDKDMLQLSREFPDIVFTLDGEGEENGDIWKAYYHNGKFVKNRAEIKFPEYNPNDLK